MREMALDLIKRLSGGEFRGWKFRALDEQGREVCRVHWVDAEKCEFGQLIVDENDQIQKDPASPAGDPWVITRSGKLKIERVG